MNFLKDLNKALEYIEENLTAEIDYQEVARRACCSEYHFKRMFSYLAGLSLSEYIRRRRLTLAAFELSTKNTKVIDVAAKYGYNSPDAFTRAFQSLHGVTPTDVRFKGHLLKAYPPMKFQLAIKGGNAMNYRIVEKEAFRIVGIMKRVSIQFEGVNPEIEAMSKGLTPEIISQLKRLSNTLPSGIIQASTNFSEGRMEEKGGLDHYIGVATTLDCSADFACLEVPRLTWAVFKSVGPFPETLQNTWGRIYAEWFPTSDFEHVAGPEILWSESPDTTLQDYTSEIWIPVCKK